MSNEVRVGLFFFVSLASMLGFTLFVTDIGGPEGAYTIAFNKVEGLSDGDAVTYNGVKVGRVRDVVPEIRDGKPLVLVKFDVYEDMAEAIVVNEATEFGINQGLLGGFRLSIVTQGAGGKAIGQANLSAVVGKDPLSLNDAIASLSEILEENRKNIRDAIDKLPVAVGNFAEMSGEIRDVVKENREGVKKAVDNISDLAGNANDMVKENREGIKKAVDNIGEAGEEIKEMVAENRENLKKTVDGLPATVESIKKTSDQIGAAVEENREGLKKTVDNIAEFSPKLNRIGTQVEKVTKQISEGKGTIGKLVFEETLHEKAEDALTSVSQRMEELKPLTAGISDLRFYVGVEGAYNTDAESAQGTVYLRLEPRPWKLYEFGITYRGAPADRDTVEEDPEDLNIDISFLYGRRFFPDDANETFRFTGKVGLLESKIGGVAQINLVPHKLDLIMKLRGKHDGFDTDDRRYEDGNLMARAYLEYRVWRRVYVYVGGDDLIDEPSAYLGIRAEILDNDLRNASAARAIAP